MVGYKHDFTLMEVEVFSDGYFFMINYVLHSDFGLIKKVWAQSTLIQVTSTMTVYFSIYCR